eukprot:TRINITY_DN2401_c0_g1_i3.p1 TRINITY_DN2401_c0_g1~~TRINITY_DN2401_c0_g1_i3.p1  ORF type:complete len:558 (+),score=129.19 TRINITY_DN2401_c0_g1_i3:95-1768(+)
MGKKIGDYILGSTLGSGAYAKVKKAVHGPTKKTYAIKIINCAKYKSKDREEWLRREVAVLRKLDHPNIMKLFDVMQQGDKMHLVLEYVNGGELLEVIAKVKRLFEDEARHYFHQLMSGVAYMHSLGIVHRDLKPENILVTDKKVLKIADFGLSNIVPQDKSSEFQLMSTIVGSPDYCAPEVVQEKNYDGFKADVYSCGTILYTMVSGSRPFEAKDEEATLQKVAAGIFIVPRHVSKDCDSLINGMMEMDPDKRMSVKKVLAHPWFTVGLDSKKLKGLQTPSQGPIDISEEEIAQAIQQVHLEKASGNVFSLIAGLQTGDVDALVGKGNDVKFLLTVHNMQQAFTRVVGLLKKMRCKVQERKTDGCTSGRLLLYSYITLVNGIMTFTTELQARPPSLVATTLRKERGDTKTFEDFSNVISAHLCDLFEEHEWEMVKGVHRQELFSPLAQTGSPFPTGSEWDVTVVSASPKTFHISTRLCKTDAANMIYDKLTALDTNPVLLRNKVSDQYRLTGFITPDPPVLLTFNVDVTSEKDCSLTFTLMTGDPKLFAELQAAVQG